ncbi:hypothetical protein PQX77_003291 [Marasmius sp. AFHP31]|nr:hypothetical protein PQX77_003291 [Marasmius sp. AFHP31]
MSSRPSHQEEDGDERTQSDRELFPREEEEEERHVEEDDEIEKDDERQIEADDDESTGQPRTMVSIADSRNLRRYSEKQKSQVVDVECEERFADDDENRDVDNDEDHDHDENDIETHPKPKRLFIPHEVYPMCTSVRYATGPATFAAAEAIADVLTASLREKGNPEPWLPSPLQSSGSPPSPLPLRGSAEQQPPPEPTPLANDAVEEVWGPDLGPEETGTRPMYTGRAPWVGTHVWVTGSFYKGCSGVIRDAQVDWSTLDTIVDLSGETDLTPFKSGLLLDVELNIVRDGKACPIERIDYKDIVESNSYLRLNAWKPLHHFHEVWYLRPDVESPPRPVIRLQQFDEIPVKPSDLPRNRTPSPPPQTHATMADCFDAWNPLGSLPPTEKDHWILHRQLVGHRIQVRITGGLHASNSDVFVKTKLGDRGAVEVKFHTGKGKTAVKYTIPHYHIDRAAEQIKTSTETSLMVVTAGETEHIGKLVRRIRTFYLGERKEENLWIEAGVISRGESDKETLTAERLELHPHLHLARVDESRGQRAAAKAYMYDVRAQAAKEWDRRPEVRPYATSI